MNDISALHRMALEVTAAAAANLRERVDRTVNLLSPQDVKMQADVDSEELVRRLLAPTGLPVVGEEQGGDASLYFSQNELYWVLDPLDGTFNYMRNQPAVCVSLALMRGREPLCGIVHDFRGERVYAGEVGQGVTINGAPVTPRWANETAQACLMTGFPAAADKSPATLAEFVGRVGRFKKIRMIGSAALAVAYVGTGLADAYLEDGTNLWDVAAGLAIVKAAGGYFNLTPAGTPAAPLRFNLVAAGKPEWLAV